MLLARRRCPPVKQRRPVRWRAGTPFGVRSRCVTFCFDGVCVPTPPAVKGTAPLQEHLPLESATALQIRTDVGKGGTGQERDGDRRTGVRNLSP
jgi:hypothetical protein